MARDMVPEEIEVRPGTPEWRDRTRKEWLAALRSQGARKCEGHYELGNAVCALGLLREIALAGLPSTDPWYDSDMEVIGSFAGLSDREAEEVVFMNDGVGGERKYTFAEIADIVEGWFK